MEEYNLSKQNFTEIPNDDLYSNQADLIREFPNCCEVMLRELDLGYEIKGNFLGKFATN